MERPVDYKTSDSGAEIEVTPQFQLWTDEVQKLFGGLDIFTVDAIHTSSGKDYILGTQIDNAATLFNLD